MGHAGSRICVKEEMAPNGQAFKQNKKEGFASPDIEASDQAWTTAGAGSGQWNVSTEQDPEQGDTHRAAMVLAAGGEETGRLQNGGRAIGYSMGLKA